MEGVDHNCRMVTTVVGFPWTDRTGPPALVNEADPGREQVLRTEVKEDR